MNKLTSLVLILVFAWESSAHAELSVIKTPFWQVPFDNEMNLSIKLDEDSILKINKTKKSIAKICQEYKTAIPDLDQVSSQDTSTIDLLRTMTEGMSSSAKFSVEFKTSQDVVAKALKQNAVNANKIFASFDKNELLPYYNQQLAQVSVILDGDSRIVIANDENSLLAVSQKAGLKNLPTRAMGSSLDKATITVSGRDAICDLIEGRAHLELTTNAWAQIKSDELSQIKDFYYRLSGSVQEVLSSTKSPLYKASLFGYLLAKHVEDNQMDSKLMSSKVVSLVEMLFDQQMNPTSYWESGASMKSINPLAGNKNKSPMKIQLEVIQ